LETAHTSLLAHTARQEDNGDIPRVPVPSQLAHELETVDLGHHHVRQHDIGDAAVLLAGLDIVEGLLSISHGHDVVVPGEN